MSTELGRSWGSVFKIWISSYCHTICWKTWICYCIMLIPLSKSHDRICVGLFLDYVALNCVSVIQVLYCLNYFRIIISLRNHQLEDICFCKSYKSLFLSQGSLDYSRSSVSIEILDLACLFLKKKNLLEFWLKLDWLHMLIWEV